VELLAGGHAARELGEELAHGAKHDAVLVAVPRDRQLAARRRLDLEEQWQRELGQVADRSRPARSGIWSFASSGARCARSANTARPYARMLVV